MFMCYKIARNRLSHLQSSLRQRRLNLHQISAYFKLTPSDFLTKYGVKLSKIELVDEDTPVDKLEVIFNKQQSTDIDIHQRIEAYRCKEYTNLSDESFQAFINHGTNFPSVRFARECRFILNNEFTTMSNSMGSYNNPRQKIEYFLKFFKNKMDIKNNIINIRLAGDGTQIADNLTAFNFFFSFLDKKSSTDERIQQQTKKRKRDLREDRIDGKAVTGNFVLGTFRIKSECYNDLKTALSEIVLSLSDYNEIIINNVKYKIEFWLGGDLKFLSLALGIVAANGDHPCPWCESNKSSFSTCIQNPAKKRDFDLQKMGKVGYQHERIFKFIKLENVIPDILHCFLRISDKLTDYLIIDLEQIDLSFSTKVVDSANFKKLVGFLDEIKIKNSYRLEKGRFVLRSFNGLEKIKIFDKINIINLFPNLPFVEIKSKTWNDFSFIIKGLKENSLEPVDLKSKTKSWLENILKTRFSSSLTPYQHIFTSHLHNHLEHLKEKGFSMNSFSMQGVEKCNDFTTQYYQRSSNRKGDVMMQLVRKRNRIEVLWHHDSLYDLIIYKRRELYQRIAIERLEALIDEYEEDNHLVLNI